MQNTHSAPFDPKQFRNACGCFATGITIVTTEVDGEIHGMTANAVSSVSLDPLLLLVCVDRGARCYQQLEAAGAFGVNILAADQEELSNLFARSSDPAEDLGDAHAVLVVDHDHFAPGDQRTVDHDVDG